MRADGPLVSVVIPVFNGERYLQASLDSILGQTYRDTEFLIMDDASTDGAPEILRAYASADDRVRYQRQPQNVGIFANINAGIALARGDYVAIHHSDDLYHPEILAREVDYLDRNLDVGAVFCIDVFIDGEGREYGRLQLPPEIRAVEKLDYPMLLNGLLRHQNTFIRGGSGLFRSSVLLAAGPFEPAYLLRADLDMWLRLARQAPIAILDEYLVWYRYGHDNASLRYDRLRTESEISFTILDRYLAAGDRAVATPDALAAYEGHKAEDLLKVAVNRYIAERPADARATLASIDPRRIVGTDRIQRWRLLVLWAILHILVRMPRMPLVSRLFYRRWHGKGVRRRVRRRRFGRRRTLAEAERT